MFQLYRQLLVCLSEKDQLQGHLYRRQHFLLGAKKLLNLRNQVIKMNEACLNRKHNMNDFYSSYSFEPLNLLCTA